MRRGCKYESNSQRHSAVLRRPWNLDTCSRDNLPVLSSVLSSPVLSLVLVCTFFPRSNKSDTADECRTGVGAHHDHTSNDDDDQRQHVVQWLRESLSRVAYERRYQLVAVGWLWHANHVPSVRPGWPGRYVGTSTLFHTLTHWGQLCPGILRVNKLRVLWQSLLLFQLGKHCWRSDWSGCLLMSSRWICSHDGLLKQSGCYFATVRFIWLPRMFSAVFYSFLIKTKEDTCRAKELFTGSVNLKTV